MNKEEFGTRLMTICQDIHPDVIDLLALRIVSAVKVLQDERIPSYDFSIRRLPEVERWQAAIDLIWSLHEKNHVSINFLITQAEFFIERLIRMEERRKDAPGVSYFRPQKSRRPGMR